MSRTESTTTTASRPVPRHPVDEVLPVPKLAVYGFQHVLAFYATGEIVEKRVGKDDIARALRADGLATTLGGILNSFPYTCFAENVGLVRLTRVKSRYGVAAAEKEHEELGTLAREYRNRFGFPLVMAVRDQESFDQVLRHGWERLNNSPTQEHATALIEVAKIAAHGFDRLVADANPIHSARLPHLDA